jgi:predicted DNA-binding transcriptional regulator AlpA
LVEHFVRKGIPLPNSRIIAINSHSVAKNRSLRIGKINDVSSIVKMAPSTIRAKMRAGEFPVSIRLSYKLAVWNLDEVEAWFQEKLSAAPVYVPHVPVAVTGVEAANV